MPHLPSRIPSAGAASSALRRQRFQMSSKQEMQQVANGAFPTTGKTAHSQGTCDAGGLSATHGPGRRRSMQGVFQLTVSVFGQRGPVLISAAHRWKNQSSSAAVSGIPARRRERCLFFFLSEIILKTSLGSFIEKMCCSGKWTLFEQSNNQKGRRYVLSFSFLRYFAPVWQRSGTKAMLKTLESKQTFPQKPRFSVPTLCMLLIFILATQLNSRSPPNCKRTYLLSFTIYLGKLPRKHGETWHIFFSMKC